MLGSLKGTAQVEEGFILADYLRGFLCLAGRHGRAGGLPSQWHVSKEQDGKGPGQTIAVKDLAPITYFIYLGPMYQNF